MIASFLVLFGVAFAQQPAGFQNLNAGSTVDCENAGAFDSLPCNLRYLNAHYINTQMLSAAVSFYDHTKPLEKVFMAGGSAVLGTLMVIPGYRGWGRGQELVKRSGVLPFLFRNTSWVLDKAFIFMAVDGGAQFVTGMNSSPLLKVMNWGVDQVRSFATSASGEPSSVQGRVEAMRRFFELPFEQQVAQASADTSLGNFIKMLAQEIRTIEAEQTPEAAPAPAPAPVQ